MKTKLIYKSLITFAFLVSSILEANAYEFKVSNIPDSLKENAVAVVRDFSAVYTQSDVNNATYKVTKVITVLNDKGNSHAHFYSYRDNFTDFKKFEGIIRDNNGKEIKKIKKGDLIESSISSQMATDNYTVYYEVSSPVYPYTVEYSYEQRFKNGILGYPRFMPITNTLQSVEKASYRIELPVGIDVRYKSGFDCKIEEDETEKLHIYNFSSGSMKAISNEILAPHYRERMPMVRIAPNAFSFDGVTGNMSSWEGYGLWVNKLLDGRDNLSPAIVEQVRGLVKGITDKRTIIKTLYEYHQANSRYVNVSLGIGGFQPIPAESVFKNRFGDCKGLSNVMKAMLKAVDIPSNYCEIYSGSIKTLDKDFFDMTQTNHAILMVPLEKDSIWLECTSQVLPFGYIHPDIEGHDALVMTEKGGVICRLPSYSSNDNVTKSIVTLNIAEDGKIAGNMQCTEYLHGYGAYHYLMKSNDRKKHVRYLNNSINLPKVTIGEIKTAENVSERPDCTIEADFTAVDAINKTGVRMFIPLLPLTKSGFDIFRTKTREYEIVINYGYSEIDSIIINIPRDFRIESLPKPVNLTTPFGTFTASLEKNSDTSVIYKQYINIYRGRYDKSKYDELRDFYHQISSTTKKRLVIKKEEK